MQFPVNKKHELIYLIQALDLWMAGCMVFVFAALGEFVVVKVLDVQYQFHQSRPLPKPLRLSAMEKGQCQTLAMFDGTNVRARKAPSQTPTTPCQVKVEFVKQLKNV